MYETALSDGADERAETARQSWPAHVGGTDAFTTYWSHPMPSEVRFTVVREMLEQAGWTFARVSGSHHVFTKPGRRSLPIVVKKGKVGPVYVEVARKACREEEGSSDR